MSEISVLNPFVPLTTHTSFQGLRFLHFPYLLTLQLKRFDFDYTTMHRIKLNDRMSFPEELDMSTFIDIEDEVNTYYIFLYFSLNSFPFNCFKLLYEYECFAWRYVCVSHVCLVPSWARRLCCNLDTRLETVGSHCVEAGNQTGVIWEGSQ